jgi:hypothetical protein
MRATLSLAFASVLIGLSMGADAALAGCKRFGFTVNDYGKEGPIRDAKALLDKHVASWAKEKGISDFRVGPKKVSCDLFLDFIVFDEHTCTASANVCWGDQIGQITSTGDGDGPPPAPLSKAEANGDEPVAQQTAEETTASDTADETADADDAPINLINGVEDVATKAVDPTIDLPDMEARPKKRAPVRDITPPQTADSGPSQDDEAPSTVVETGALSRLPSEPTGKTAPEAPVQEVAPSKDRAAAAAAAAAAATAAERAAAAAETAANAAKEAAAAAVAASNASRGEPSKMVPPLDSASR